MRALVLLVLALLLAAPTAAQEDPRAVKTMVLGPSESQQVRQFFGTVVARQTVDLAFQVAGQLVSFPVVEGQPVEKGAIVAALDQEPFELALARAQVEKAQADRARARLEALSERTVSEASLEDARSAAQLAAIAVRDARRSLENATLHAPFDGLVAARLVANFATVQAGAPVARLHDIGEWRVEIEVP